MTIRWQAVDPFHGWTLHATFTSDQRAYRFRNDDGSESAATWKAAQNTPITQAVGEVFRLRVAIQETAGGSANNQTLVLQSNVNGGGWFNVGSTSAVRLASSPHFSGDVSTTKQMTGTSGTFRTGLLMSVTNGTNISFSGNDHTEVEWANLLVSGDVPDGATVQFRVTVNGSTTNTVTASPSLTAIGSPTLTSTGNTGTSVSLSSTAIPGATSYEFQNKLTSAGDAAYTTIQNTSSTTATASSLSSLTSYTFRVRAITSGSPGPWSDPIEVTTDSAPAAPSLTASNVSHNSVLLTSSSHGDIYTTVYEFQRKLVSEDDTAYITIVEQVFNTSTISDLQAETSYNFRIRYITSGVASEWSTPVTVTTREGPPTVVPSLSLVSKNTTSVTLVASSPESGIGYEFHAKLTPDTLFGLLHRSSADTASHLGLMNGTSYDYRVRTYNSSGNSPWSPILTVVTNTLSKPPAMAMGAEGKTAVRINASVYPGSSEVTAYEIQIDGVTFYDGPDPVAYADDLTPGTPYTFRGRYKNAGGVGPWADNYVISTHQLGVPVLSSPSETETSITLSWTSIADSQTYELQRKLASEDDSSYTTIQNTSGTTRYDDGLIPETSYSYRVRASANGGYSAWSTPLVISTVALETPILSISAQTGTSIDLSWTSVNAAQTYEFQRSQLSEPYITLQSSNLTSFSDTDLPLDATFEYRVRAEVNGGSGPWSATLVFVTISSPLSPQLLTPTDNSTHDGSEFTWSFQSNNAVTQDAFAFKVVDEHAELWWDGADWSSTEVFVVSPAEGVTLPEPAWNHLTFGDEVHWAVATREADTALISPYADSFSFIFTEAPPIIPRLFFRRVI